MRNIFLCINRPRAVLAVVSSSFSGHEDFSLLTANIKFKTDSDSASLIFEFRT